MTQKKLINVMNTAFRDGFQSVYGARVKTADFLPALIEFVHGLLLPLLEFSLLLATIGDDLLQLSLLFSFGIVRKHWVLQFFLLGIHVCDNVLKGLFFFLRFSHGIFTEAFQTLIGL